MKILSWNINGFSARSLHGDLDLLLNPTFDIICLQETRSSSSTLDFPGFLEYIHPSKKKGYAGVAVMTRIEPEEVYSGIGWDDGDDGRVLTLKFAEFFLVNVYAPAISEDTESLKRALMWHEHLSRYLEYIKERGPVIVCGDMNMKARFCQQLLGMGNDKLDLVDIAWAYSLATAWKDNYEPAKDTWYPSPRAKNGERLDYFFVDHRLFESVTSYDVLEFHGSDHRPIIMNINTPQTREKNTMIY